MAVGAGRRGRGSRSRRRRGAGVALLRRRAEHRTSAALPWGAMAELAAERGARRASQRNFQNATRPQAARGIRPPRAVLRARREALRTAAIRRQPARRATRAGLSAARARAAVARRPRPSGQSEESWVVTREAFRSSAGVQLSSSGRGWACRVRARRRRRRARLLCRLRAQRSCQRPSRGRRGARAIGSTARRKSQRRSAPAGGRGARPQSILIIRRAFDRFGQTAFPKIEVAGRPRSDAPRARGRGRCGRAARAARELPPPRHQTMGGDPVGVVVSAVGVAHERDYRVSPAAAAARAECAARAARVGPPSGTVRSFTASRHFLEMCEFHPTEAAGGRARAPRREVRARRRLFVWLVVVARAPCVLSRSWRRRVSCTRPSSCATATTSRCWRRQARARGNPWSGASADGSPQPAPGLAQPARECPPSSATSSSSARGGRRRCTERRFLVANAWRRRPRCGAAAEISRGVGARRFGREAPRAPLAHAPSLLAMRGSLAAAGPSQQLGQRRCSSSTRASRRSCGASTRASRRCCAASSAPPTARSRSSARSTATTRGSSAPLRSELGAAEADLARAQQHAIDQDLEARVRHRVVLAELDLPSAAAARAVAGADAARPRRGVRPARHRDRGGAAGARAGVQGALRRRARRTSRAARGVARSEATARRCTYKGVAVSISSVLVHTRENRDCTRRETLREQPT